MTTEITDRIERLYIENCHYGKSPDTLLLGPEEIIELVKILKCIARYETIFPPGERRKMQYRGMTVIVKRSPGIEIGFSDDPITNAGRFLYSKKPDPEVADITEAIDNLKEGK